jgi:hypothetical protein
MKYLRINFLRGNISQAACYEHGNELSASVKIGKFHEKLSDL